MRRGRIICRHCWNAADTLPSMATSVTKSAATTTAAPQNLANTMRRLVSLDVARGITIAFMILVNNGGSGKYSYAQLEHSAWNGWTLTDLVFPSFLFIAGIAIVFSNEARMARGESKGILRLHVIKRAVILFPAWASWSTAFPCSISGRCASTACCSALRFVFFSPACFICGTAGPGLPLPPRWWRCWATGS